MENIDKILQEFSTPRELLQELNKLTDEVTSRTKNKELMYSLAEKVIKLRKTLNELPEIEENQQELDKINKSWEEKTRKLIDLANKKPSEIITIKDEFSVKNENQEETYNDTINITANFPGIDTEDREPTWHPEEEVQTPSTGIPDNENDWQQLTGGQSNIYSESEGEQETQQIEQPAKKRKTNKKKYPKKLMPWERSPKREPTIRQVVSANQNKDAKGRFSFGRKSDKQPKGQNIKEIIYKIIPYCTVRLSRLDSPSSQSARRMQSSANRASVASEDFASSNETATEQPEKPMGVADMIAAEWPMDIAGEEVVEYSENSFRAQYSPMSEEGVAAELQR
ncbi:PREDICTED: uncharacterized protein LOC105462513 [Wasmannia auropunctata]|uniref:uncharacterized protein LOC105462513 n=1 Tax=Wasmannia auropunctata TaxID=64793 RepID=UPI0005EF0309|nr:PREDICTED: uncharacterized protein LOC105462513 [Wasmannia auropunctata]